MIEYRLRPRTSLLLGLVGLLVCLVLFTSTRMSPVITIVCATFWVGLAGFFLTPRFILRHRILVAEDHVVVPASPWSAATKKIQFSNMTLAGVYQTSHGFFADGSFSIVDLGEDTEYPINAWLLPSREAFEEVFVAVRTGIERTED